MSNIFYANSNTFGYILVVSIIIIICLTCWFIRKRFSIGTYTKDEEENMKTNLDLLITEEEVEEGKDYQDEV